MVTTFAVAGGRAALLGGLAPLLLLSGVLLLVLAAPASKDRLNELRVRFRQLTGALPEPVRTYFDAESTTTDGGDDRDVGWKASDPAQFAEFFGQLVGDDDAEQNPGPGQSRTH
jgi:hypothetical protein